MTTPTEPGSYVEPGAYTRDTRYLTTRITADGLPWACLPRRAIGYPPMKAE